jgi:hypothetical protein
MIAVGHTSVGVIVGIAATQLLPDSWPLYVQVVVVGLAGVVSHYLMDLVPHGHYDFNGASPTAKSQLYLAIDLGLPLLIVAVICVIKFGLGAPSWLVAAGIIGAQLPDVFDGLLYRGFMANLSLAQAEQRFHLGTHWHNPTDKNKATPQGGRRLGFSDIWQAIVVVLALALLIRF